MSGTAILAMDDPSQEALARVALLASSWSVRVFRRDERRFEDIMSLAPASGRGALVVLDPARAVRLGLRVSAALRMLHARLPAVTIVLALADRECVSALGMRWALECGANAVVGRIVHRRLKATTAPLLTAAGSAWQEDRIAHYATALLGRPDAGPPDTSDADSASASAIGADLDALARELAAGAVRVEDRRWRTTTYPQCFVGKEATSWLSQRLSVARPSAEQVGRALQARGALYHVVGEQPFRDGNFFYRCALPSAREMSIPFDTALAALTGPQGPAVADRSWRGLSFPRSFVGSDAAQALATTFRLDFRQAVCMGRAMLELHVFRHVADEHDFFGTGFYYRFAHDMAAA